MFRDITANYWRANQFPGYLASEDPEFQYIKHEFLILNSNTDPAKSQSSWRVRSPGCSKASGCGPGIDLLEASVGSRFMCGGAYAIGEDGSNSFCSVVRGSCGR